MTDLARQPAGTSSGGQFAPTGRGEADIDVGAYSEPDGTMFFPARFETAEDHLRWWQKVEVPDAILQDVVEDYPGSRDRQKQIFLGGKKWERPEKDPEWSDAEYVERQRESIRAWNARVADFEERVPQEIDRFKVRDAVRTHLAWRYAYTLPPEEQEKLRDRQVQIDDLNGTPPAFDLYFAMNGYADRHPDAFTKLPREDNRDFEAALEAMRREIAQTRRLSEMGLRTQHVSMGVPPDQSDQIIAGERVTGKNVSSRKGAKEWAKRAKGA